MGRFLQEAAQDEAMSKWTRGEEPELLTHTVWTFDFMGLGKHDIACPVCFDASAMLIRDVTPDRYRQTVQPCDACAEQGYRVLKLPKWLARWLGDR